MKPSARQTELDRYAVRHHWERGPLKSWRFWGFTVAVGTEWPKAKFHASNGRERQAFGSLEELTAWVKERTTASQ